MDRNLYSTFLLLMSTRSNLYYKPHSPNHTLIQAPFLTFAHTRMHQDRTSIMHTVPHCFDDIALIIDIH